MSAAGDLPVISRARSSAGARRPTGSRPRLGRAMYPWISSAAALRPSSWASASRSRLARSRIIVMPTSATRNGFVRAMISRGPSPGAAELHQREVAVVLQLGRPHALVEVAGVAALYSPTPRRRSARRARPIRASCRGRFPRGAWRRPRPAVGIAVRGNQRCQASSLANNASSRGRKCVAWSAACVPQARAPRWRRPAAG